MNIDLQFKIRENPNYLKYLRSHSYWYKLLNRNSNNFRAFENEVRKEYKLTKADRISKTLDTIEMMEKIISTLK